MNAPHRFRACSLAAPLALGLLLLLASCGGEDAPPASAEPLPPPAAAQGFQLAMDVVSPPHGETWKCQIGRLPGDGAQAVGRVEHKQASAVHHMDVSVLMTTRAAQLEPGVYDCAQLYREYPDLMEQPILYAS